MRLLNCHIENFGKLHDFSMDFSAGCNTICQENGFGKSTLASFIRVMFYGFLGESKRNNLENERKRYQPWQGGIYGGSLSFEVGERQYCLRRVFHDKVQNDEFELRDQKTNLISTDYTERIGEELFGVNQESFIRTVYIGQNDMVTSATDDINAKIGNLTDDTNDLNRFEEADKKLTDYINALSPKRKTGSVYKLKEEASALHTQIRALQGIEESITQQMELMEQKRDEIAHLKEEQSAISKKQEEASKKKDIQAKKEIYEHLCQELLRKEKEVTDCEKKLHDSLPDKNVLDEMSIKQKQSEELYAKIQLTQLQENEILRINELKNLFQNESDPKAIISEMSSRWNERNTKKSTLLMKKSTLATLISSKEADKRRQTEAARKRFWQRLIVGVILLFAGIGIVGFYMAMKASISSPVLMTYSWSSFDMLSKGSDKTKLDTHTYIHEFGHQLGLNDYYDTSNSGGLNPYTSPMGGLDMMDNNVGDHSAFSKFALGWVNPYVVNGDYGEVNIELKSLLSDGECIILPTKEYNNTPFDEYFMIEYVKNDSINKLDSTAGYPSTFYTDGRIIRFYSKNGIRITHIDARGVDANLDYTDSINDMIMTKFSNTASTKEGYYCPTNHNSYVLTSLISGNASRNTLGTFFVANNQDLIYEGTTIDFYSSSVNSRASMIPFSTNRFDDGSFFNYSIKVNSISEDEVSITIF